MSLQNHSRVIIAHIFCNLFTHTPPLHFCTSPSLFCFSSAPILHCPVSHYQLRSCHYSFSFLSLSLSHPAFLSVSFYVRNTQFCQLLFSPLCSSSLLYAPLLYASLLYAPLRLFLRLAAFLPAFLFLHAISTSISQSHRRTH